MITSQLLTTVSAARAIENNKSRIARLFRRNIINQKRCLGKMKPFQKKSKMNRNGQIKINALKKIREYNNKILDLFPNKIPPWSIINLTQTIVTKKHSKDIVKSAIVKTEDTGKITEKAICIVYETEFVGSYNYSVEDAIIHSEKFKELPKYLPGEYIHSAANNGTFDFTCSSELGLREHLSIKTNKTQHKVAPHSIGQPIPSMFCERIGIPFKDNATLKSDFQNKDILITKILPKLEKCTFDATIVYYHEKENTVKIIEQLQDISWKDQIYTWTKHYEDWKGSSTLKIDNKAILEVQFHEKSRKNMVNRWHFKNILEIFKDNFNIINVYNGNTSK